MDLFVVPTIGFRLLYAFTIVRLDRRQLVWTNVTLNPTADWVARQIAEAFPWDEAPKYLIRDRDSVYGAVVTQRLRAMGIRDRPIAAASPWQLNDQGPKRTFASQASHRSCYVSADRGASAWLQRGRLGGLGHGPYWPGRCCWSRP
jgi:hypothetical protein